MPILSRYRLRIIKNRDGRYLVNRSDLHLNLIVIADISVEYYNSVGALNGTPFYIVENVYRIEHVPPHSRVALPKRNKSRYTQHCRVERVNWRTRQGQEYRKRVWDYVEVEEDDSDTTVVDSELRRLKTESFHSKPESFVEEYIKHVFLVRWKRDLYLVNNVTIGAEHLRYRRKHSRPNLPARAQGELKPQATFEIRDLPAGSFFHIMDGFDPNVKPYSFEVKTVNWRDGKTYRGAFPLGITALNYQSPHDSDFTRIERTPTLIEEDGQPEEAGNDQEESR